MLGAGLNLLRSIAARLRTSSDGEATMTLNRVLFCIVMAGYIWVNEGPQSSFAPSLLIGGLLLSFGILAHLLSHPKGHSGRRAFAILVDLGTVCLVMHRGDEATAVFFPLILWVMCGNGFRFGLPGLWLSTTLGILGFSAVAATTQFWRESLSLTIGLMIGLIILPAYVSILIKKLYLAKARAEAASRAKSEFLTNVSHELRTPLQAIVGASGLLAGTKIDNEQTGLIQTVADASNILLAMISGLLGFSTIEKGKLVCEAEDFNVVELLDEVTKLTHAACQAKGLSASMHIGQGTPLVVKGDKKNIREVLINLAGNAIKFTDQGGVLLTVDLAHNAEQMEMLIFEVVDTGIGVSIEIRERVFEQFFSGATPSKPSRGGLGIGLAICKKLVDVMKGDIGLRSVEHQGAAFWFQVPVGRGESAARQGRASKADVALFMPYNIAKGRLFKLLSDQNRNTLDAGSPSHSFSEFLQTVQGKRCILFVATPKSDTVYLELSKALKEIRFDPHVPVVLVDEMGQVTPTFDLRRLAQLRLAWNFTDEDMVRVLASADSLLSNTAASSDTTQPVPSEHHRVLVVDDNRTSRVIFSKMIESIGHVYQLAANGDEALDALEQDEFSLVLMDVNMPDMDGLEVTRLRRLAELGGARTPIVGMTADASPGLVEKCRSAGMDDCLVKPVSMQVLRQLLAKISATSSQIQSTAGTATIVRDITGEPKIDGALISSLESIGGQAFVQEVLSDFHRDAASLLNDLSFAMAQADIAKSRFVGHALASASANIGAVQVRRLGLEVEAATELRLKSEGQSIVDELREATASFMEAIQQRSS